MHIELRWISGCNGFAGLSDAISPKESVWIWGRTFTGFAGPSDTISPAESVWTWGRAFIECLLCRFRGLQFRLWYLLLIAASTAKASKQTARNRSPHSFFLISSTSAAHPI